MRKTILVVDDFVSVRNFVCETLQRKGYDTLSASNGEEAYAVLMEHSNNVNLVLTDYRMTDCTGFELLRRIKDNPQLAKVPVVFLTTESNPDKMKLSRQAGLAAWIKKPYRSDTFFSMIESAFDQSEHT